MHPVDELIERLRPKIKDYYERLEKLQPNLDQRLYTRRKVRSNLIFIIAGLAWLAHVTGNTPESLRDNAWPRLP